MESIKEDIMDSWVKSMPPKYVKHINTKILLDQYFVNVHEYYRKRESDFLVFHFQSPELQFRSELVRWLKALQNEFHFSTLTLHLAIYLLDFFMDNHSIKIEKLSRVALVCLMIASKYEDIDGSFPRLQTICEKVGQEYDRKCIVELEFMVLKFYDFNIGRPTMAHFLQLYSVFIIDLTDLDRLECSSSVCKELFDKAQKFLDILLDKYLTEMQYLKFEPSQIAAFFVLLGRKFLELNPYWTKMLQFITGYSFEDLQPCITLYNSLESNDSNIPLTDVDISSDDSGYTTSGSCSSPSSTHSSKT